uniref:DUF4939 domain-containing protein n=1 Tax=Varanus komodoensis TaxID=61221 RepID=A0A8D2LZI5_VARKO
PDSEVREQVTPPRPPPYSETAGQSPGDTEHVTSLANASLRRSLRLLEQVRRQDRNALCAEIDKLQATQPTAAETPPQMQQLKLRRCPVEPPLKYDGRKEGFTTFKAQCELYMHLCQNDFPDEKTKVGFLINQLTGTVARWATAKRIAQDPILNYTTAFLDALEKFLGMASCKEMAICEIKRLMAGNRLCYILYNQIPTLNE